MSNNMTDREAVKLLTGLTDDELTDLGGFNGDFQNSLRTRMIEILSEDGQRPADTAARLADALIRELRFASEYSYGTTYPKVPVVDQKFVRYVTDWVRAE